MLLVPHQLAPPPHSAGNAPPGVPPVLGTPSSASPNQPLAPIWLLSQAPIPFLPSVRFTYLWSTSQPRVPTLSSHNPGSSTGSLLPRFTLSARLPKPGTPWMCPPPCPRVPSELFPPNVYSITCASRFPMQLLHFPHPWPPLSAPGSPWAAHSFYSSWAPASVHGRIALTGPLPRGEAESRIRQGRGGRTSWAEGRANSKGRAIPPPHRPTLQSTAPACQCWEETGREPEGWAE